MKDLIRSINKTFIQVIVYLTLFMFFMPSQAVFAVDTDAEPMRLREFEDIFIHALIAIWALCIPYFMFVVGSIGFQWMVSGGDEQKLAGLKKRGGNVALSFAMVFGGYLVVRLVISLLGLKSPAGEDCFASPFGNSAIFQFFFPEACSG